MNTNFENLLREYQPDLYQKTKSEQNELSKDILKLRLLNKLSVEETAKYLNMSIEDYLNYEFGESRERTVLQYQEVLLNMKNIFQKYENNIKAKDVFGSYKLSFPKFNTIEKDRINVSFINKNELKKSHSMGDVVFSGTEEKIVISSTSEKIFNKVSNFFKKNNNTNEKYLKREVLV